MRPLKMSVSDLILDLLSLPRHSFPKNSTFPKPLRLACLKQGLKACRFVTRKHVDSEPWWGTGSKRHTTLAFHTELPPNSRVVGQVGL